MKGKGGGGRKEKRGEELERYRVKKGGILREREV